MRVLSTKHFENLAVSEGSRTYQNKPLIYTEKIKNIDLIKLYENTSKFDGKKFFWGTPNKSLKMVGLGVAKEISVSGDFKEVGEKVREFSNGNPNVKAFGGFAFEKNNSQLWESFGNGVFIIPKYLIVENESGQYITTITDEEINLLEFSCNTDSNKKKNKVKGITEVASDEWKSSVSKLIEELNKDLLEKVVVARTLEISFEDKIRPSDVLKKLDEEQSNCYLFSFEKGVDCFIGSSPEKLVSLENSQAHAACLAGTIERGTDEKETKEYAKTLLDDPKNRVEHQLVVDLIIDKFTKLCNKVTIPDEPEIMVNKFVQHLYTPISGEIKKGKTILDFVEMLHPTPALGGTPTMEAMKVIRELESFERGLFAAPIGWLDGDGNGDFAVGIRSGLIRENVATIFAGAGIIAGSNVEEEFEETALKFKPMLHSLCE